MTCQEMESRLPAYLEDLLTPDEKKHVEGHMAGCPRCSRTLADLKKTEQLLRGLEEVEPPPFFEQRIMSRVREEAERKPGILRKLFYPLHVKVPIQALATILIAVLGFYIYEKGDPEIRRSAPLPIPLNTLERGKDTAAPAVPSAVVPAARAPVAVPPDAPRQRFALPPSAKGGKADMTEERPATMPEEHSSSMKQARRNGEAEVREIRPALPEMSHRAQDRAGRQAFDRPSESLPTEGRHKEELSGSSDTAEAKRKVMFAPAPSPSMSGAAVRPEAVNLTIQVRDISAAIVEIEARLSRAGARIIERRRGERDFLKAEMAARDVTVLLERLGEIGRVDLEKSSPAVPDGKVTLNVTIIRPR